MSKIYLLTLATQQSQWLSARQTIIAGNIANSDTPGYRAMDVQPFSDVLNKTQITMASTSPLDIEPKRDEAMATRTVESDSWSTKVSGNSVSLEQELMKEGDISRSYTMNTNITRVFHQMYLSALK